MEPIYLILAGLIGAAIGVALGAFIVVMNNTEANEKQFLLKNIIEQSIALTNHDRGCIIMLYDTYIDKGGNFDTNKRRFIAQLEVSIVNINMYEEPTTVEKFLNKIKKI